MFNFGALTLKNYAFQLRAWEVTLTENLDITDSFFSPISFELRGGLLRRVLPKSNLWISNNTRFGYDGLVLNRIALPYVVWNSTTLKSFSEFFINIVPVSWAFVFNYISFLFSVSLTTSLFSLGALLSLDQLLISKWFSSLVPFSHIKSVAESPSISLDNRFIFINRTFLKQFSLFSSFILVSVNPRLEAPLLLTRLRKLLQLKLSNTSQYSINKYCFNFVLQPDLLFNLSFFGGHFRSFVSFIFGKHIFCRLIKSHSLLIFGSSFFKYNFNFIYFMSKFKLLNLPLSTTFLTYAPSLFSNILLNFNFSGYVGISSAGCSSSGKLYLPTIQLNFMATSSILPVLKPVNYLSLVSLLLVNFLYYRNMTISSLCSSFNNFELFLSFIFLEKFVNQLIVDPTFSFLFTLQHVDFDLAVIFFFIYFNNLYRQFSNVNLYSIVIDSHAVDSLNNLNFSMILPVRSFGERSQIFLNQAGLVAESNPFRKGVRLALNDQSVFFLLALHLFYYSKSDLIFLRSANICNFFMGYSFQLSLETYTNLSFYSFWNSYMTASSFFVNSNTISFDSTCLFYSSLKYLKSFSSSLSEAIRKIWYVSSKYNISREYFQ